jgi:hypothetical protein
MIQSKFWESFLAEISDFNVDFAKPIQALF